MNRPSTDPTVTVVTDPFLDTAVGVLTLVTGAAAGLLVGLILVGVSAACTYAGMTRLRRTDDPDPTDGRMTRP